MKKSLSIFCAVLTAGMLTAPAYAANPYISGNCGATWFDNINTSAGAQLISGGINVTGAVGMAMDNFRLEAEVGNQTNIDQVITAVFGLKSTLTMISRAAEWSLILPPVSDQPGSAQMTGLPCLAISDTLPNIPRLVINLVQALPYR